jgi:hypothetical protein
LSLLSNVSDLTSWLLPKKSKFLEKLSRQETTLEKVNLHNW